MALYAVISGEDRQPAESLKLAKLYAGEMQLDRPRIVHIERRSVGRLAARRWQAVLSPSCDVVLIPCALADADQEAASASAVAAVGLKYLPPPPPASSDSKKSRPPRRERRKRIEEYARQWQQIEDQFGALVDAGPRERYQFEASGGQLPEALKQPATPKRKKTGGRPTREVIHLPTGRRYASNLEAAMAVGVRPQTMNIRLQKAGSGWVYVDTLVIVNSGGSNGAEEKRLGSVVHPAMESAAGRADADRRISVLS